MIIENDAFYYGTRNGQLIENLKDNNVEILIPNFSAVEYMLYHIVEKIFDVYKYQLEKLFKEVCETLDTEENKLLKIYDDHKIQSKRNKKV